MKKKTLHLLLSLSITASMILGSAVTAFATSTEEATLSTAAEEGEDNTTSDASTEDSATTSETVTPSATATPSKSATSEAKTDKQSSSSSGKSNASSQKSSETKKKSSSSNSSQSTSENNSSSAGTTDAADSSSSTASTSGAARTNVAEYAKSWVGKISYYLGASGALVEGGQSDCSWFIYHVLNDCGLISQWYKSTTWGSGQVPGTSRVASIDQAQPGDILFWDEGSGSGHVVMYVGNGQVVGCNGSSPTSGAVQLTGYTVPGGGREPDSIWRLDAMGNGTGVTTSGYSGYSGSSTSSSTSTSSSGTSIDISSSKETHISENGTYTLTGSVKDGQVIVDAGLTDVTIILNNITIKNAEGKTPILLKSNAAIRVDGENTLTYGDLKKAKAKKKENKGKTTSSSKKKKTETCAAIYSTASKLNITGEGSLTIKSVDDGIYGASNLTFDGPTFELKTLNNGVEARNVRLMSGKGVIDADGDGIHAFAEKKKSKNGKKVTVNKAKIYVKAGNWRIKADKDGLDSQNKIVMAGGVLSISTAKNEKHAAVAYKDTFLIKKGTFFAGGSSKKAKEPSSGTYVHFSNLTIKKGDTIEVTDAKGNVLYSAVSSRCMEDVVVSGDKLKEGDKCKISIESASEDRADTEATALVKKSED